MTIRSRMSRRASAAMVVCAFLVLACSGAPAAPSPTGTGSLAIPSPAPLPAGWYYRSTTDPELQVGLPADWETTCPTATGAAAPASPAALPLGTDASAAPSGSSDRQQRYRAWTQRLIESGDVRLIGSGHMTCDSGWIDGASVRLTVRAGDASLGTFASRQAEALRAELGFDIDRSVVAIPLGVSVRLAYRGWLGDEVALVGRDYLVMLPDGRSLDVAIDVPDAASDAAADEFATTVMDTLRLGK